MIIILTGKLCRVCITNFVEFAQQLKVWSDKVHSFKGVVGNVKDSSSSTLHFLFLQYYDSINQTIELVITLAYCFNNMLQ